MHVQRNQDWHDFLHKSACVTRFVDGKVSGPFCVEAALAVGESFGFE